VGGFSWLRYFSRWRSPRQQCRGVTYPYSLHLGARVL